MKNDINSYNNLKEAIKKALQDELNRHEGVELGMVKLIGEEIHDPKAHPITSTVSLCVEGEVNGILEGNPTDKTVKTLMGEMVVEE